MAEGLDAPRPSATGPCPEAVEGGAGRALPDGRDGAGGPAGAGSGSPDWLTPVAPAPCGVSASRVVLRALIGSRCGPARPGVPSLGARQRAPRTAPAVLALRTRPGRAGNRRGRARAAARDRRKGSRIPVAAPCWLRRRRRSEVCAGAGSAGRQRVVDGVAGWWGMWAFGARERERGMS